MFEVEVQNAQGFDLDEKRIVKIGRTTMDYCGARPNMQISVVFTRTETIKMLNWQHRGVEEVTDVLSFPSAEMPEEIRQRMGRPYGGDLMIAYPYVQERAEKEGHNLHDALELMVVHGTLHLLGYTHDLPANKSRMWKFQREILQKVGVDPAIVDELEDYG
ncbi:MAG: rRNA maturation RNase YbeY [Aggregatilineales bacterium]